MKYAVRVSFLISMIAPHITIGMSCPLNVIKHCRPIVRAVCYKRKLDTEIVHHIAQQYSSHSTVRYYLGEVSKGYHEFLKDGKPIVHQKEVQEEIENSIFRYRTLAYARGCAAGLLIPAGLTATAACGAGAICASFTVIAEFGHYVFVGAPVAMGFGKLLGTTTALSCGSASMGMATLLCLHTANTNIIRNEELIRNNIQRNAQILEQYVRQQERSLL